MKKLVSLLAIALFTVGFAQETKPAKTEKKSCCSKDKKSCDKKETADAKTKKSCCKTKKTA